VDRRPGVDDRRRTALGHGLNLARRRGRASAGQLRHQRRGVVTDRILRPRAAAGASAHASPLKSGSGRALPCPTPPVTMPTKPCTTQAKQPSHRPPRRHSADQDGDSRLHLRRCLQPQVQRRSTPGHSPDRDGQSTRLVIATREIRPPATTQACQPLDHRETRDTRGLTYAARPGERCGRPGDRFLRRTALFSKHGPDGSTVTSTEPQQQPRDYTGYWIAYVQ